MAFPFWLFMALFWLVVIFFAWDILSPRGKKWVYVGILAYVVLGVVFFCKESFASTPKEAFTITGFPRVVDGDTFELNGEKIRLLCMDTPESYYRGKTQYCLDNETDCGFLAKQKMMELVGRDKVVCTYTKRDVYGRILGMCFKDYKNNNYNYEDSYNYQITYWGYAWFYPGGKECKPFEQAFLHAQRAGIGLFSNTLGGFKEPKLWRKTRTND